MSLMINLGVRFCDAGLRRGSFFVDFFTVILCFAGRPAHSSVYMENGYGLVIGVGSFCPSTANGGCLSATPPPPLPDYGSDQACPSVLFARGAIWRAPESRQRLTSLVAISEQLPCSQVATIHGCDNGVSLHCEGRTHWCHRALPGSMRCQKFRYRRRRCFQWQSPACAPRSGIGGA